MLSPLMEDTIWGASCIVMLVLILIFEVRKRKAHERRTEAVLRFLQEMWTFKGGKRC